MHRLIASALAGLLVLASACQTTGPSTGGGAPGGGGNTEPITLGIIDTLSGANAPVGTDAVNAAKIAVEQINAKGGIMGRQVKLEVRDEELKPDVSVQRFRELNSAGVKLIMGFTSSADCLAVIPVAAEIGSMVMGTHCAAMPQTTDKFDPHFVRTASNDSMNLNAMSAFIKEKFPTVSAWDVFGYDYVTGHDQWNLWPDLIKKQLGTFTAGKEVWVPLTATDYRSYLTTMMQDLPANSADTHGLLLAMFGAGIENTSKQGKPFDFFKKWKVSVTSSGIERLAQTLKSDGPDVWNVYDYWYKAYDTPMNKAFVDDYQKAYKDIPSGWSYQGYVSVYAYKAAIEKAGSTDVEKLMKAFEGLTYDTPGGPVTIRPEDHQAMNRVVSFHVVPDASTPEGWKVPEFVVVSPDKIMPPVNVKR